MLNRATTLTRHNASLDTFEKILTLHSADQHYSSEQTASLKRVFERLCAEQGVAQDLDIRENMARMVLMASHANLTEDELYELTLKVAKRFPHTK